MSDGQEARTKTRSDHEFAMKMWFGYLLLAVIATLAFTTSLGKVEAATSAGLDIILGGLISLSGAFGGWAFNNALARKADARAAVREEK